MASLDSLISAVADDLNRTDVTAQCSDAVVMVIRQYDRKNWWFNETMTEMTATSTSTYALPARFREMFYVEARYDGQSSWTELERTDLADVRHYLQYTAVGNPSRYTLYNESIVLDTIPSADVAIRLYHTRSLPVTASASNAWTIDCFNLIRAGAAKTVALRTLHDPDLARMHGEIENLEFLHLVEENERRLSSGKAKPWS